MSKGGIPHGYEIRFPGGKKVEALTNGFVIATDQSKADGGDGSAPAPYTLSLASIGTCAGIFVASFLESRHIDTRDLKMRLDFSTDPKTHLVDRISIDVDLPRGVPRKYQRAIERAVALCAVKRSMENPPRFETNVNFIPE